MKNKLYKVIYFFCVSVLVFVYTFNAYSLTSWADVPSGQIVVSHSGTWQALPFHFSSNGKYYTVSDPTGIPTSTYLATNYFYTTDNEKFYVVPGLKTFTAVLNKIVGIIYDPNQVNSLFTSFQTAIGGTDTDNNKYIRNCLYDLNDNFLGYCLNDISGCYYGGNAPENSNVKDDGNYSDNVKNYYDYQYNLQDNSPDFFTLYDVSTTYIMTNYMSSLIDNSQKAYFNGVFEDTAFMAYFGNTNYGNHPNTYFCNSSGTYTGNVYGVVDEPQYAVYTANNYNGWISFCDELNIKDEMLLTDFIDGKSTLSNNGIAINYNLYNYQDEIINQFISYNIQNMSGTVYNSQTNVSWNINIGPSGIYSAPFDFEKLTIYKNLSIYQSLENNSYSQDTYYTDSYNNYDSNNDNSLDMPISIIDNSITSNSTIYTTANNDFYNYYDNGYYDTSSSSTNITNITNNYYSDNGGGDDPDDPNDPDDPDDPDDPGDVLSQILQALLRFFNAIGAVLGTILTGILTVVSEVLEAIASITVSLTSITDFFGAIFSWIPDPVPQILGLGFSICILCGIIKFIRG